MVVDAYGMGQVGDILFQDIGDFIRPIAHKKGTRARIQLAVIWFHGLMEHDLLPPLMDLMRKIPGFRELGKDGKGEMNGEIQEWRSAMPTVPDVVYNQGDTGLKSEGP
jgi:hypothetical protein